MVAFWRLGEPLTDSAHLRRLLDRLTRRVGGDRELADPVEGLVAIPGTRNDNVYPSTVVTIDASTRRSVNPTSRRWTLAEIEHAMAFEGKA